jgi:hypothetical protein
VLEKEKFNSQIRGITPTQGSEEHGGGLGVEVPHLSSLIGVVVLIACLWCLRSKLNNIPNAFVE